MATLKIPTPLRSYTQNKTDLSIDGSTIESIFSQAIKLYPGLENQLFDQNNQLKQYLNIYINDLNIRDLENLASIVSKDDVISIIPAIAGG